MNDPILDTSAFKPVKQGTLVIYHGNCSDGFTAAWAAWRRLGPSAEYLAADHENRPSPEVYGRHVLILDFSFSRVQTLAIAEQARSLKVLDHHETARRDLEGLPFAHFDNSKSGSLLAWEEFHPDEPVPLLVQHINDRDLRTWKMPTSQPFLAWFDRVPRTFANWDRMAGLAPSVYTKILTKGRILMAEQTRISKRIAQGATPIRMLGHPGLVVASPIEFSSEVGALLAKQSGTYGVTWTLLPDRRVRVSFRSVPSFSVGDLAHALGGGGHCQSAGCVLLMSEFLQMLGGP